jgi:hypothetical protein
VARAAALAGSGRQLLEIGAVGDRRELRHYLAGLVDGFAAHLWQRLRCCTQGILAPPQAQHALIEQRI